MRNFALCSVVVFIFSAQDMLAQGGSSRAASGTVQVRGLGVKEYEAAMAFYKSRSYVKAADLFFKVSRANVAGDLKQKSLLFFGLSMYRLNLKQIASFPLVELVKTGNSDFKQRALDVLVSISDALNDNSLLDYAVVRMAPEQLSETAANVAYYRVAEFALEADKVDDAIGWLQKSLEQKGDPEAATYSLALAFLKKKQPEKAIPLFEQLVELEKNKPPTNRKKGVATLGLARAYYQAKQFDQATEVYRRIPKDHPLYRESLMELSWSLFRAGRFRSAMTPLLSLHSPFYSDYYDPESILLQGIILLFSCRFEDTKPLIKAIDENYYPAIAKTQAWTSESRTVDDYIRELDKGLRILGDLKSGKKSDLVMNIPFFLLRSILEEGDVSNQIKYLNHIRDEQNLVKKVLQSGSSRLQQYSNRLLVGRLKAGRKKLASLLQSHLNHKVVEFEEISGQFEFLKYEVLNGLRTQVRNKVLSVQEGETIDSARTREYYIQNGYRYWPMQGEYWRDEVGSYQYVGVNLCEENK